MKKYRVDIKAKLLMLFLLLLPKMIFASSLGCVLESDGLLNEKVFVKINEIGHELHSKTGVQVFVYTKKQYLLENTIDAKSKFDAIKNYEKQITKDIENDYAVIAISFEHKHINLLMSERVGSFIDKDEILNSYMVPLLASNDKNTIEAKVSAAVLNGYSQIAEEIADEHNIKLESNIKSNNKTFGDIWKIFMYILIIGGLFVYVYALIKRKNR